MRWFSGIKQKPRLLAVKYDPRYEWYSEGFQKWIAFLLRHLQQYFIRHSGLILQRINGRLIQKAKNPVLEINLHCLTFEKICSQSSEYLTADHLANLPHRPQPHRHFFCFAVAYADAGDLRVVVSLIVYAVHWSSRSVVHRQLILLQQRHISDRVFGTRGDHDVHRYVAFYFCFNYYETVFK